MQVPIENKETFCTGIKRDIMLTFNYHQEKLVTNDILHAWAATFFPLTAKLLQNKPLQKTKTKKLLIPFQWIRTFSHRPILTTSSRTAWLSI